MAGEGESLDLPDVTPMDAQPELMAEPEPLAEAAADPEPIPLDELPSAGLEPEAPTEAAPVDEEPIAETAVEEPPPPTGELYNVFLSKITDTSKRDKAAELIAKIKGCSGNEAKELTTRLVIPLAKNVAKEKAEDILTQFKKLKIFGRMTKVK